ALTTVVCFFLQLRLNLGGTTNTLGTVLTFLMIGIPFVFAGIVICIALTSFPTHAGRLYAADLAGSAVGCLLTIPILDNIHAPSAVILDSGLAMLAAGAFGIGGRKARYAFLGAA